ncbi:hypothetical protein [Mucilaginibacter gilvus]|uniref:Uncharacterized protein n=1 Tax=Mucilaginibacter gilvus TaxID=2305909 RepID=A0A3S3YV46_9SPHI|nr:hypothetical protein [Mucilaginibacter gilvus]RWY50971.1 hypothetical protein EPL05_12935 [Mucilaginibacter gilvus]
MKFFYLYLIGGIVALILLIYQLIVTYPDIKYSGALFYIIPTVLLFYMANKAYHVKKDKELM